MELMEVFKISAVSFGLTIMAGCKENSPMITLGLDDSYTIARMQKLCLSSAYEGDGYRWILEDGDGSETLSSSRELIFVEAATGIYHIKFELIDEENPLTFSFTVNVVEEEVAYSPYISKVYEYSPAPGQFVNKMPWYDLGDTADDMRRKAEEAISGTTNELISLGAYGGYVVFGFDHTVVNVDGEKDFMILGNAFYDDNDNGERAGSCEPGIVEVSVDANGNGIPDDEWYELAGSDYNSPLTLHGYSIIYNAPVEGKAPVPSGRYITDAEYIGWSDSEGATGFVAKNIDNTQSYYPLWTDAPTLTFSGSRLPQNAEDLFGNGSYYKLQSFGWGYVDNHPDMLTDLNSFDIGWAVDRYGVPVKLPGVDFIKVYTAINQYCGRIGETSTEVGHGRDLHVE